MKKHFLIFLFIPSVLFSQHTRPSYQIFETKTGRDITIGDLVKNLKKVDVLVFGEEHNDSTGHMLEAMILEKMIHGNVQYRCSARDQ
jgi:uncharacterized iron-regulated protein